MRVPEVWRTTTFRLSTVYGVAFAVGVLLLLGLVYWRTASALTQRVDAIVAAEAAMLARVDAADLPTSVRRQNASAAGRLSVYALFSPDGIVVAGPLTRMPAGLQVGGPIREASPGRGLPYHARLLALRLPWGEILVVGRNVDQVRDVRGFILEALVWSGALIAGLGLAAAVAFSLGPLRRLQALQAASHRIMAGDLAVRMPIAGRRDELDLFAGMVNAMIAEVERLLGEAKSANDAVAHDLRTPLAHVRALLQRTEAAGDLAPAQQAAVGQAIAELDQALERFRALLRISEIEAQARRAGFRPVALEAVLRQAVELYEPLAEAQGVELRLALGPCPPVEADDKLLFEALSNLIDNAIKFSPVGGAVQVALRPSAEGPAISIADRGPGIAPEERQAVLQRFYRGSGAGPAAGSGLGLSIVAAIARLHRFELRLEDNAPGLRVVLVCATGTG